jgi:hypothetical protein
MELNKFIYPESDKNVVADFYREIWDENEYDRYFKINHGDKVIDCGAFIGMFSLYARDKGASQIIAIEADENRYNCLKQNCNGHPITTVHKCINDNDVDGSISIESLLNTMGWDKADMVKMDIEGYEWPVLLNMSDDTMNRVDKWAIEVHIGWNKEQDYQLWEGHGIDLNGHYLSKLVHLMERFSVNGFKINYERVHKGYDIAMLYAHK